MNICVKTDVVTKKRWRRGKKMKMNFKKLIAIVLTFTLLMSTVVVNAEESSIESKSVYVDGVEFIGSVDNFVVTVESVGTSEKAKLVIDRNGNGYIEGVSGLKYKEKIKVDINELSDSKFEAELNEKGVVKSYKSKEALISDEYKGQIAIGGVIVIGAALLEALILLGLVLVIAGVTCYAISEVIEDVKQNNKYYYKAYLQFITVFINPYPITLSTASWRVAQGYSVYTYTDELAQLATLGAGLGIISESECHGAPLYIGTWLEHYHTANRNGSHIWFGIPK